MPKLALSEPQLSLLKTIIEYYLAHRQAASSRELSEKMISLNSSIETVARRIKPMVINDL